MPNIKILELLAPAGSWPSLLSDLPQKKWIQRIVGIRIKAGSEGGVQW